jgi:leucyl aminopeptidase
MINLATLTGAILVALGQEHAGLFSNNDELAQRCPRGRQGDRRGGLAHAARPAYDKMIDSKFADMKNSAAAAMAARSPRRSSCSAMSTTRLGASRHRRHGLGVGAVLRAWRFEKLKSQRSPGPRRLELLVEDPVTFAAVWARAEASLAGVLLARELVAEPANRLTPREFAKRLRGLESEGLEVQELGRSALKKLGAGGILAVGGGSAMPPRLVVLRWKGDFRAPPVAFVGKGLCFDTGGISIKGAAGMEAMRADMAGAAACAGAMLALARRKSPCPAVAILAIAENMTSGSSYRPGDVLRMMSGRTVEVVDTDAEGRLVLADALHFAAARERPQAVLDLATLTGSVITALGHHRAGLFGNDAALGAAVDRGRRGGGRAALAAADRRAAPRGDQQRYRRPQAMRAGWHALRVGRVQRGGFPARVRGNAALGASRHRGHGDGGDGGWARRRGAHRPASAHACWTRWWSDISRTRTGSESSLIARGHFGPARESASQN